MSQDRSAASRDTDIVAAIRDRIAASAVVPDGGRGMIGTFTQEVPRELAIAAGRQLRFIIPGLEAPTTLADAYMEADYSHEDRASLHLLLSGAFASLDLLVFGHGQAQLYYYASEILRRGKGDMFPPLHLFDLLSLQEPSAAKYNLLQVEKLRARIEQVSAIAIDDAGLAHAIGIMNGQRDRLREFQAKRWDGTMPAAAGWAYMALSHFIDPDEFASLEQPAASPAQPGLRVLLAPYAAMRSPALHVALAAEGLSVVGENDWMGSRAAASNVAGDGPLLPMLANHVWKERFSHDWEMRDAREAWLREQAQSGQFDAVVFYIPPDDTRFGWDYPGLKSWLATEGIDSLLIDTPLTSDGDERQVRLQTCEWLARKGLEWTPADDQ